MIVLVLNNEDLNQVTWEQRVMEGDPKFAASQEIPYVDYAAWAEMIGLRGIKIDEGRGDRGGLEPGASPADRPVIISALTDPDEPPLPPHITFEQAEGFAEVAGSATREGGLAGAVEAVREKAHEFVSGTLSMRLRDRHEPRIQKRRRAPHRPLGRQRRTRTLRALALGSDGVRGRQSPRPRSTPSTTGRASATR